MLIAILNDTHFGARNASELFHSAAHRFFHEVFFPECDKRGVKHVLHLGDFFDTRRFINYKTIETANKAFLEPLTARSMRMDIIPGNHDIFYKNTLELNSLEQLLGNRSNVSIYTKPTILDYAGVKIGLVPWICASNKAECEEFIKTAKVHILAGHFEVKGYSLLPGGEPMSHGYDQSLFHRFAWAISGHYHCRNLNPPVHYLGTQLEFTWSDCDDEKGFYIYDTETDTFTHIVNPHKVFRKLWFKKDAEVPADIGPSNIVCIVVNESMLNTPVYNSFFNAVSNRSPAEVKVQVLSEFQTDNSIDFDSIKSDSTQELISKYVDSQQLPDEDRESIKSVLTELYTAATTGVLLDD